jgi:hypothetical protein
MISILKKSKKSPKENSMKIEGFRLGRVREFGKNCIRLLIVRM